MKKTFTWISLVTALVGIAAAPNPSPKVSVTRWPQDRTAAVSLTFDDGINTHLDVVRPILKRHHLTGTFFVSTGRGPWEARKQEWKQLAIEGNELGNHTVHHPCLLAGITPHSQDYTPDMMEAEIAGAAHQITQLLNSNRGLTFAYPCGNMSFGKPEDEVKNSALFMRYVSEHSFGARKSGGGPQNPDELNPLDVNDLGPTENKGCADLLTLAQPAVAGHNWGVYHFHGVGGDYLSITPEALDELTGYLAQHPEIWTATFGDVLRYVQERKAASIEIKQFSYNSLIFSLEWPMNGQIYDVPLTLRAEIPALWHRVRVTGDGQRLHARVAEQSNATVIVIDVRPETKIVEITKES